MRWPTRPQPAQAGGKIRSRLVVVRRRRKFAGTSVGTEDMVTAELHKPALKLRQPRTLVAEQGPPDADIIKELAHAVPNDEQNRQHDDSQQDDNEGELNKAFARAMRRKS